MKLVISLLLGFVGFTYASTVTNFSDPSGDIDSGITTGGGTLDIIGMEVANTATDINFKLTVNGNLDSATGGVDWGKFMIGIATGKAEGTMSGNGWGRPINLSYGNDPFAVTIVGMNYWIGSWVDGGGDSQLWAYDNSDSSWNNSGSLGSFSVTSGATSDILYSVSLTSLGLTAGDSFYFDAYSSGGGGADSAIDSLANPNVSISNWGDSYTSYSTAVGGPGLNFYTVVPEPSAGLLLVLGTAGILRRRR